MNEHGYIRSVHRHIPKEIYCWKINDNYEGGVADAFYSGEGGVLFCEYKYMPTLPKRKTTIVTPKLSPAQLLWLKGRYSQQIPTIVVLGTPAGGVIFGHRTWESGVLREELEKYALPQKAVASIIYNHCIGYTYVTNNDSTYCNTYRPKES